VIGRNCRFLQGVGTDSRAIDLVRKAIRDGTEVCVCVLNYKKSGAPFWNRFYVAPLRGLDGRVVNLLGVQVSGASQGLSS
jgi:hypothetical protein